MMLTQEQYADLILAAFCYNVFSVVVGLVIYDLIFEFFGWLKRSTFPRSEGCTLPGGAGDDLPGVNSTLGAVSTPAGSCRLAGQNSGERGDE